MCDMCECLSKQSHSTQEMESSTGSNLSATKLDDLEREIEEREKALAMMKIELEKRGEELDKVEIELEKREKSLHSSNNSNLFHTEQIILSDLDMISYEEMSNFLPDHLWKMLGRFAANTPLEYYNWSDDEYIRVVAIIRGSLGMPYHVIFSHEARKTLFDTK